MKTIISLITLLSLCSSAFALRIAIEPLEKRVEKAEKIFIGKLVNRVEDGDWVRAELVVETALHNVKKDEKIEVIWRKTIGGHKIFDSQEGNKGIAILIDKHQGRYWLRGDKFENLNKLDQIKKLIKKQKQ